MKKKKTDGFDPNVRSIDSVIKQIDQVFNHEGLMCDRFSVEVVTEKGSRMRLRWDVGMAAADKLTT